MEHSYLVSIMLSHILLFILKSREKVDFSKDLICWVKAENYSLLDINMFPRPFANGNSVSPHRIAHLDVLTITFHSDPKPRMSWPEMSWHTYGTTIYSTFFHLYAFVPFFPHLLFRLSSAQRIVLIGHGAGCGPLTQLLEERSASAIASNTKRPHLFRRFYCYETCQRCCSSCRAFEDPFNPETFRRSSGMVLQGIFTSLKTTSDRDWHYTAFACGCAFEPSCPARRGQDHQRPWQNYEDWYGGTPFISTSYVQSAYSHPLQMNQNRSSLSNKLCPSFAILSRKSWANWDWKTQHSASTISAYHKQFLFSISPFSFLT